MDILNDTRDVKWWGKNFKDWESWKKDHHIQGRIKQGSRVWVIFRGTGPLPQAKVQPTECLEADCAKSCQTRSGFCKAHVPADWTPTAGKGKVVPLNGEIKSKPKTKGKKKA